ncbi:MAG: membrane protein insertase YidC [Loktanella sp.]|jgi:YidC/Oxa1 family membrane protein insertase|nr:membrane protein insertase YidC [Loktanella sp.]MDO7624529.1 membrane protein insertase YidC [Loktanella sp.]MDO7627586.1 membrane protein insertase YidC [Loktanella sp.]MDO7632119.1 membrane protein insertase YidC [Loktanella sp.]MDO7666119.1 membrane protein insertase YidC [Loktanella sp.]
MDDQNKNLILATALSALVIVTWTLIFPPEVTPVEPDALPTASAEVSSTTPVADPLSGTATLLEATDPAADAPRVSIETPELSGSISLVGGRIDDLSLTQYKETLKDGSPIVQLLRPVGEADAYFASFGWTGVDGLPTEAVPGPDTLWSIESGETLTPSSPVTLKWNNGQGQIFRNTVSIDDKFMFTFAQSIENATQNAVAARAYGLLRRHGEPTNLKKFFILHEGLVRMSDGQLEETKYSKLADYAVDPREGTQAERIDVTQNGWIGYTDHYWMTTLIPDQNLPFRSTSKYFASRDLYQAEAVMDLTTVAAGETATVTTRMFAGAKEWETIRDYENNQDVTGFLDSIDWGWFFFLTKPIFWLLHTLHQFIGNMGWSIIALTVILKALVLPLAYKSYVSMAKMKELQPEMEKLKERTGEDKQAMQQGMMKLYKENKVNPASGCLPILLQIPIFFSLYKVIFVTIELRHVPWLGWIRDLSAPDPSSILNLFGLLPWGVPEVGSIFAIFSLGVLPIILGISMWMQQKLNLAPTEPTQKMIMAWMPWVFMFMLGSFASGLVLYWIANNTITFTQQYLIMRSHGAKPDVFGNIKSGFSRKDKAANDPKAPKGK